MQHLRTCVQFLRHTVERLLYHVCVDVNHIFVCVSCRQNGSERIRARGVASSFQRQKTICVSSFCGCGVFFESSRSGSVLSQWVHRSRGTPQVTSTASLDERKGRVVSFTTSSFKKGSSAEQLLGTCRRSRLKKQYIWI